MCEVCAKLTTKVILDIIKTELRNKMADDWLNHRMLCYIEREIFTAIENDKILRHYQDMRKRRIQLPHSSGIYKILVPIVDLHYHCYMF